MYIKVKMGAYAVAAPDIIVHVSHITPWACGGKGLPYLKPRARVTSAIYFPKVSQCTYLLNILKRKDEQLAGLHDDCLGFELALAAS